MLDCESVKMLDCESDMHLFLGRIVFVKFQRCTTNFIFQFHVQLQFHILDQKIGKGEVFISTENGVAT